MGRVRRRRPTFSGASTLPVEGGPLDNPAAVTDDEGTSETNMLDHRATQRRSGGNRNSAFVERWLRRRESEPDMVGIPVDPFSDDAVHDSDSLKSNPTTRRSSNDSSIDDVCMPLDSDSETENKDSGGKRWPDLSVLEEFKEKEVENQASLEAAHLAHNGLSSMAVNEADSNARLRPTRFVPWASSASAGLPAKDMRFTYFRDDLPATIHSPTISGLLRDGQTFRDLFGTPKPVSRAGTPLISDNRTEGPYQPGQPIAERITSRPNSQVNAAAAAHGTVAGVPNVGGSFAGGQALPSSSATGAPSAGIPSRPASGSSAYGAEEEQEPFWLDILNPTEEEMRVISKCFGVHPLTAEDIVLQETREKVEIFRNYYFVCFTSVDIEKSKNTRRRKNKRRDAKEDTVPGSTMNHSSSANSVSSKTTRQSATRDRQKLRPLAVYQIVFPTGIITVHYRTTPHTVNVRRRIRLLRDYLNLTSDWISYALIDDITDGFGPLIALVDEDVSSIEDMILHMHGSHSGSESESEEDEKSSRLTSSGGSSSTGYREWRKKGDMLLMIGESRKLVMSILGLLGNKADVIKGFSKRVTEQWSGAPRMEIAMYLSDIQDHLVTMVQSLNHYEKLLARSHSNYLAQLNIDMTKANNDLNDVLGKISVLGTIVLPMNIITGLWGMNVLVPGQGVEDSLVWFYGIMASMLVFAVVSYIVLVRFL